jgi:hypothetical protein
MNDLEPVLVYLPPELPAFARACAGGDDVSEVVAALGLLREELTEPDTLHG